MDDWQRAVLLAVLSNGFLAIIIGLFNGVAGLFFALLLENLQRKQNQQIQEILQEHQVRFTKLHETQANVIAHLYRLLVKIELHAGYAVSRGASAGREGTNQQELARYVFHHSSKAASAIDELERFFNEHRIYLDGDLCAKFLQYDSAAGMATTYIGTHVLQKNYPSQEWEKTDTTLLNLCQRMIRESKELRQYLENRFRNILA